MEHILQTLFERTGRVEGFEKIIKSEITIVQRTVLEAQAVLPWFVEAISELNLESSTNNYVIVPDNFCREKEGPCLQLVRPDGSRRVLEKLSFADFQRFTNQEGEPSVYCLENDRIHVKGFDYSSDFKFKFSLHYYAHAEVAEGSQWIRFAPDLVVAEVGRALARKYLKDDALNKEFSEEAMSAWENLNRLISQRSMANIGESENLVLTNLDEAQGDIVSEFIKKYSMEVVKLASQKNPRKIIDTNVLGLHVSEMLDKFKVAHAKAVRSLVISEVLQTIQENLSVDTPTELIEKIGSLR